MAHMRSGSSSAIDCWRRPAGHRPDESRASQATDPAITRRNRGIGLDRMIRELNSFLTGWVTYFRHAACKST